MPAQSSLSLLISYIGGEKESASRSERGEGANGWGCDGGWEMERGETKGRAHIQKAREEKEENREKMVEGLVGERTRVARGGNWLSGLPSPTQAIPTFPLSTQPTDQQPREIGIAYN